MSISLSNTTGDPTADSLLAGVVGIYETAFPERIRGYYIANKASQNAGQIDLYVLFSGTIDQQEARRFKALTWHCNKISPMPLDIHQLDEVRLLKTTATMQAAIPIYGDAEALKLVPLESIDERIVRSIGISFDAMWRIRSQQESLFFPLKSPQESESLRGYDVLGLERMAHLVISITTTINALVLGKQVANHYESVMTYYYDIDDEWADYVVDIYQYLGDIWAYEHPQDVLDRARLMEFCEKLVHFENYFLAICRAYILRAVVNDHSVQRRHQLMAALSKITYPGLDYKSALASVYTDTRHVAIREMAENILRKIASKPGK